MVDFVGKMQCNVDICRNLVVQYVFLSVFGLVFERLALRRTPSRWGWYSSVFLNLFGYQEPVSYTL